MVPPPTTTSFRTGATTPPFLGAKKEATALYWRKTCKQAARRRNWALLLTGLCNALCVGALAAAGCFFVGRLFSNNMSMFLVGGLLFFLVPTGWLLWQVWSGRSVGRFWGEVEAAAMIDDRLNLKSQLSAAYEGLTPWPEPMHFQDAKWQLRSILLPFVGVVSLLLGALLLPVGRVTAGSAPAPAHPRVERMEMALTTLEESGLIDSEALEEMRQKLEPFLERQERAFWSPSELEAIDHLTEDFDRRLETLAETSRGLQDALQDLVREAQSDATTDAKSERGGDEKTFSSLEPTGLSLDSELAEQLAQLLSEEGVTDPEKAEQMLQEMERLAELSQKLCERPRAMWAQDGEEGEEGQLRSASGEPDRGGDTAPLELSNLSPEGSGRLERVDPTSREGARLGGASSLSADRPPDDDAVSDEGVVPSLGEQHRRPVARGADAALSPSERRVVERYFR